jgi:hypothetical protein
MEQKLFKKIAQIKKIDLPLQKNFMKNKMT